MFKKYPQFIFAFAIIFFVELIVITNNLNVLRYITKPLITISLMLFVFFTIKRKSRFSNKIIAGLFFSLLGDVLLIFARSDEQFFMFGLGAFLIAHLFYISAFYLDSTNKIEVENRHVFPIFMVFGFCCIAFYYSIQSYLGGMSIPVLVYAFVITMMAITAALRFGKTNQKSFLLILIGAILFMISDSLLAYNKFVDKFETANLLIMVTYMLAQFLIGIGTVERKYIKIN